MFRRLILWIKAATSMSVFQGQRVGTLKGSIMASVLWEARGLLSLQATWEKQRSDEDDTVVNVRSPLSAGFLDLSSG